MSRDLRLQVILDAADRVTGPLKKIRQGSSTTAQALRASKDELRGLERQQRNIQGFRQLQQGLRGTSDRINQAQQRVREMREQMRQGQGNTQRFRNEFRRANEAVRNLTGSVQDQRRRLGEKRNALEQAGISTKNLGSEEQRLKGNIDRANQSLQQHKQRLSQAADQQRRLARAKKDFDDRMGRSRAIAGTGARAFAAGGAQLYAGGRLMAPGFDFDEQMSQVQALTRLEKESTELAAIRAQARELGASTTFSAGEAAGAQSFLAMAGFDPDAIMAAMPDMLNLARAGNTELAETADIASNLLSAFGLAPDEMGRLADVLTATTTRANVDLNMLGETMKYVGPVARDMGVSLEEASAMAGLLGNIGIQGSQAGTTMREMINRLTSQTGPASAAMEELGLEVQDLDGNLRPVPNILQDVMEATQGMGNAARGDLLQNIFGTRAGAGVAELIKQQGDAGIEQLVAILENSAGESARVAQVMNDNARGDMAALRSAWQEVGISIQEVNNGPIRELIQNATQVTRNVGEWVNANPELVATLTQVGGVLATVVASGGALMMLLGSILGPIAMARYALTLLGIAGGAVSLPILAVVAGLAAVAAGAYLIYKNWEGISEWFVEIWESIKEAGRAFWDWFTGIPDRAINRVRELLEDWDLLGTFTANFENVMAYLVGFPARMKSIGGDIIDGIGQGFKDKMSDLRNQVTEVGSNVTGWFKDTLGIRSPSRVFAEHGEDTLAGYRQGLARGEHSTLNQVAGISRKVAGAGVLMGAATMPALASDVQLDSRSPLASSAGPAPVSIQGDHIEIHIHAQPGMNTQDLTRQIERVLQERDADKATRLRSALYDGD